MGVGPGQISWSQEHLKCVAAEAVPSPKRDTIKYTIMAPKRDTIKYTIMGGYFNVKSICFNKKAENYWKFTFSHQQLMRINESQRFLIEK